MSSALPVLVFEFCDVDLTDTPIYSVLGYG